MPPCSEACWKLLATKLQANCVDVQLHLTANVSCDDTIDFVRRVLQERSRLVRRTWTGGRMSYVPVHRGRTLQVDEPQNGTRVSRAETVQCPTSNGSRERFFGPGTRQLAAGSPSRPFHRSGRPYRVGAPSVVGPGTRDLCQSDGLEEGDNSQLEQGSATLSGVQIARASTSIKLLLEQMAEKILRLRRAERFLLFRLRRA